MYKYKHAYGDSNAVPKQLKRVESKHTHSENGRRKGEEMSSDIQRPENETQLIEQARMYKANRRARRKQWNELMDTWY